MKHDTINFNSVKRFREHKKKKKNVNEYVSGIINGNISLLSSAITLVESSLESHREIALNIINKCLPFSGNSIRIAVTGVPGAGKSSFIETLGVQLIKKGKRLAVLAVDPSSSRSGGSILGDKTRMEELSVNINAFIRPSPSSGSLGGVARKTAETIILCEAAGFDVIFVETVGVGQSEIAVHSMVDFFLLLMISGAGDELQGIKRGIMEMADAVVINKADGDNIIKTKRTLTDYKNALHLLPPAISGWIPKVSTASSLTGAGIENVWKTIEEYINLTKKNDYFYKKRNKQAKFRMYEIINEEIKSKFYSKNKKQIENIEKQITEGLISPYYAAKKILKVLPI